jgi:hypothetical protein
MKRKLNPLVGVGVLLTLLLPIGCISPGSTMKKFVGHHSSELVALWGPPQQRHSDGRGGEIWVYTADRSWTTPGEANTSLYGGSTTSGNVYGSNFNRNTTFYANANTTWTPPQTSGYQAHRAFFVNASCIIYRYAWKGL